MALHTQLVLLFGIGKQLSVLKQKVPGAFS